MWYRYRNYAVRDVPSLSLSLSFSKMRKTTKITKKTFYYTDLGYVFLYVGGCFPEGNLETFRFTFSRVMLEVHWYLSYKRRGKLKNENNKTIQNISRNNHKVREEKIQRFIKVKNLKICQSHGS